MKKLYFLFFAILTAYSATGQVIASEDFTYPNGSLVANSAWTNTSGTAGDFLVDSGQAVVEHGTPSEDVALAFSPVTGDIYFGFDFSVDDLGAPLAGSDLEYFAHLDFNLRIDIVPGTSGGDYSIGISPTSTAETIWASDLTYGQINRIVLKFDQLTGASQLWVNPTTSADTSISTMPTSAATISQFDLRQSDSSENETVRVDDLMIGQTFDDVVIFAASMDPSVSIISPSDGTVFDPGTTSVDVVFSTANTTPNETVDITVNGVTTQSAVSPFSIATMDGMLYDVTVELVNQGGVVDTQMTSFSISALTVVADLAALRADVDANGTAGIYQLQSVPTVTYTRTVRNQKYIQDASAGILIDDNPGVITTTFMEGDGISGLTGGVSFFNGVLQFNPNADAMVSQGNAVVPEIVTIATLLTNFADYQSELVQINDATFTESGNFAASTSYTITDASNLMPSSMTFRTNFSEADYIGQPIPTTASDLVVLVGEFGGAPQVTARGLSDVTLSTLTFEDASSFSIYPNPTNTGFVNITSPSNEAINVSIFDILGKQVLSETVKNNSVNVSGLNAGVYVLQLDQNGATTTKKLVVK